MQRLILFVLVCASLVCVGNAQVQESQPPDNPPKSQAPPRSDRDREAGESSSRDTRIDISPPKNDAKDHPNSTSAVEDVEADTPPDDVQEFHPWDPHKAMKDIEVGDFYFKKKNYRAALDRYREALVYKPNDALANFRMGECLEKLKLPEEARVHYQQYLKILPHGPLAPEAEKALEKLGADGRTTRGPDPKN
jgi:tetratricopeptide (TPR) repeat protein